MQTIKITQIFYALSKAKIVDLPLNIDYYFYDNSKKVFMKKYPDNHEKLLNCPISNSVCENTKYH